MNTDDTIVLLAADPATAYREYLYRPRSQFARWIDGQFEVVARPGQRFDEALQAGDILLQVTLGQLNSGHCLVLRAPEPADTPRRLPVGQLLLRPRRRTEMSASRPVEPDVTTIAAELGLVTSPGAVDDVMAEHEFGEYDPEDRTPVPVDAAAAVPPFDPAERAAVAEPLLSARESARAVSWNNSMHPAVSGVTLDEIRDALRSYVDAAAVQAAIGRRNQRDPASALDASTQATDAVLIECVHQFQRKCYSEQRKHDGLAGQSTLDSLGLIKRAGSGFHGGVRSNATAQQRLNKRDAQIQAVTSGEFSAATWYDGIIDPSVFGWTTKSGAGLHVLLVRKLRQAERYLLTLPAFSGKTPAALGRALGLTEQHGGARGGKSLSTHTFGLAIDIAYTANPWVHQPASWQALQRAALLVSGLSLDHKSAPAYLSSLGSDPARSTGQVWDELQQRSHELGTYFPLAADVTGLREALQAGQRRGTAGLFGDGESVDQAVTRWQTRIKEDRNAIVRCPTEQDDSNGDFCHHDPPERGFLTLPRDLVIALREHACLAWGAVDFGSGATGSGDIMHFDARIDGAGRVLTEGTSAFVPASGHHPCLPAPLSSTEAESPADQDGTAASDYLGGKLWTFTAGTVSLPVAVFCPKAAMSSAAVDVLLFVHGLLNACRPRPRHVPAEFVTDQPFGFGSLIQASERPVVLAVPLLDWANPGGEQAFGKGGEHWHALARPDHLNQLLGEVLAELGRVLAGTTPALRDLIIAGHSRAYDFLEPLAYSRHDPAMQEGALAQLGQIWAFDTPYAGRVQRWTDWLTLNPRLQVHLFYRPGNPTGTIGDEFYQRRGPRLAVTRVSEIHCAVPATRIPALLALPSLGPAQELTESQHAEADGEEEATGTYLWDDLQADPDETLEPEDSQAASASEQSPLPSDDDAPAPAVQPDAGELTTRIARCIGIWETNRGGDQPAPKESSLDTVAGVHASMATIEQATMPYAVTGLKKNKTLRGQANPPLTMKELAAAEACARAVITLLSSVDNASAQSAKPDDFIVAKNALITATNLSNDDVKTMFRAVTLKGTLDKAHADMEAAGQAAAQKAIQENKTKKEQESAVMTARRDALKASLAAIPAQDRLGLGEGSLRAYITKPGNWGENRAGWQRKAVAGMPDQVGARIEAVAVSDGGQALAIPRIRSRVDAELAKAPTPSTEDIVKVVAQKNNPNEADYGLHVWQTYQRLYQ